MHAPLLITCGLILMVCGLHLMIQGMRDEQTQRRTRQPHDQP